MKNIVLIDGFGDKNTEYAVYIDGKLFHKDDSRDLPENDSLIFKLIKKIAKDNKIKIEFRNADISYALTSYYDLPFPKTLDSYQNKITKFYNKHKTFNSIKNYLHYSIPYRVKDDEVYIVNYVYSLAGGDYKLFNNWYNKFISENKTFKELNNEFINEFRILFEDYPEKSKSIWEELQLLFEDYLKLVFLNVKPK